MTDFDLVIAGGGASGLALCQALVPLKLKVLLLEPRLALSSDSSDVRAVALSLSSLRILQAMDLDLSGLGEAFIRQIRISEQRSFGRCLLDATELGWDHFGQVVSLDGLQQQLLQQCRQSDHLLWPHAIQQLQPLLPGFQLQLDDGRSLSTRFLVIADGGQSQWRQPLQLEQRQLDYQQTALSCLLQVRKPHQGRAFEHFTAQGPLALLPVDKDWYSLVWTLAPAQALRLAQLPAAQFLSELQQAFGWPLGRFEACGPRQRFDLKLIESKCQSGPDFALIGNALRQLHPVAGQGFNLALRDIALLAELIAVHELSSPELVQQYRQLRLVDQDRTLGFTHAMVSLFSNAWSPLKMARGLGLLGLAASKPARLQLARLAMGLLPPLPWMASGLSLEQR